MVQNLIYLKQESLNQQVQEKFNGLFPSVPMMIATIIAFLIVFLLLTYLLYKPVKKMMKNRTNFIQENINSAIKQKEDSLEVLNDANEKLKEAHKQADSIVNKAKIKAGEVSKTYIDKAKAESYRLLEETNQDIALQKKEFDANAKKYVIQVATELAEKILRKEISPETQDEIIKNYLESSE
ncbi:F0F1 ATP synthase subunit B [Mycoplasma sp. 4079]|uniref:F0F1 ATP synthase subunit B n=1 Tax=Mycoplasma sp. 4079 TaxID=3398615 RepID=UPI0039FC5D44